MARHKMSNRRKDKALFGKTASKSKKINLGVSNMRGGIRL